ncbi:MAG TPA: Mur ligase family protein [Rubricoccaceae bacterium]|nr:Mur ligase family protein [Rubricoccaceae bacterium]
MILALADSRRLTGPSLLLDGPGAVVEVRLPDEQAEAVVAAWERHLRRLLEVLGWEAEAIRHRRYTGGASLAFAAPADALYAATEVNEAAWAAAAAEFTGDDVPPFEAEAERLREMIRQEEDPTFRILAAAADDHGVTLLRDDHHVSAGLGTGALTWPVEKLPAPEAVRWEAAHDVPVALVTGTNGKSTTVRMLGAILRAAGRTPGLTTTDHVVVGEEVLDRGDYSGPGGARAVLRDGRVQAGVLEVARGGLLRRGLGVPRATAAAVTNVAADHLGEYGIETVEQLAEAKFVVAKALGAGGVLVTNAEDAYCAHEGHRHEALLEARGARVCWTALDPDHERLRVHRAKGGLACAVVDGHLVYSDGGDWTSVAAVDAVPCTYGGLARYNVRNALTALGLARALGVPDDAIRRGLEGFASDPASNPGRANVFDIGEARALVDFAHNAHGLDALAETVARLPARRRLVLLSSAGDRSEADLAALARAAAQLDAARYVLAELPDHLRGRAPGEVPALLRLALVSEGAPEDAIEDAPDPVEGTRRALDWATAGDLLVLLVLSHRDEALALVRTAAAAARR